MPIYHKRINGRKVWWVRVTHKALNASRVCATKEEVKTADDEFCQARRRRATEGEQRGWAPATVKQLFEAYVADLGQRGKSPDTIQRAGQTALTMEALLPELLAKPVGKIQDADVCVFWAAMAREGRRVVERIAGERRSRPSWCVARRRYIVRSGQW